MASFSSQVTFLEDLLSPKSYCLELGFSLNSLDCSPDGDYVVVAGREVFKVVDVRRIEELREHANLRINTKQSNLLHISNVKWNPVNAAKIATATWNAQVVLWDVHKRGSKFLTAYDEHKRTVNQVCWAPQQETVLVSGAQDGLLKLWDTRQTASVATFAAVTPGTLQGDAVRAVVFDPHRAGVVAAGLDSGVVQLWDLRGSPHLPMRRITAHNNAPVRSLAWHPHQPELLGSGSRDETLLVWDLSARDDACRFAIQTIAPISVVLWRPVLPGQDSTSQLVTAASTTHDLCIHLWDLFRPHMPVCTVKGHTREVTDIAWWRASADVLLSVSKDGTLRCSRFQDPCQVKVPGTCLSWNVDGTLAVVTDPVDRSASMLQGSPHRLPDWLRSPPNAGTPRPPDFHGILTMVQAQDLTKVCTAAIDPFEALAKTYRLYPKQGEAVADVCTHNATAAAHAGAAPLAEVWGLLALWSPDPPAIGPPGKSKAPLEDELSAAPTNDTFGSLSPQYSSRGRSTERGPGQSPRRKSPTTHRGPPQLILAVEALEAPHPLVPVDEAIRELLELYCDLGDVQTCCTVLSVWGEQQDLLGVDGDRATTWFLAYVDLLHQRQLFVQAAEVIKHCPFARVASISTRGTQINVSCTTCGAALHSRQSQCPRCATRVLECVVCHCEVQGVLAWSWVCGHGGHREHLMDWLSKHQHCPRCGADPFR